MKGLPEKAVELTRKRASAKAAEEIAALNLEATELKQQQKNQRCSPHRRSGPCLRAGFRYAGSLVDRRQPPPRRRLLKSGEILLGKHPIPCTVRNMCRTRRVPAGSNVTAGIPAIFDFQRAGEPDVRTYKTIWRDNTRIGVMFIQQE